MTTLDGRSRYDTDLYPQIPSARHTLRRSPGIQAGGRIIAISGLDSIFAVSDHGLIGAGKAAVESMVRNLATELGPRGITVNAVVPGPCRTESLERKPGSEQPLIDSIPLGRMTTPGDIGGVVAFLCSPATSYMGPPHDLSKTAR